MQSYQPLFERQQLYHTLNSLSASDSEGRRQFWENVQKEIVHFDAFCNSSYDTLIASLWSCVKKLSSDLGGGGAVITNLQQIEMKVNRIATAVVDFHDFLAAGYLYFVDLRHRFDVTSERPSSAMSFANELTQQFKSAKINLSFGDVVCMISDIYCTLKELNYASQPTLEPMMTGEVSSQYRTYKYFIKTQDVVRLKVSIATYLPVYYPGLSQGVIRTQNEPGTRYSDFGQIDKTYSNDGEGDTIKMGQVYFENKELKLYHDNIFRKEGASTVKVKWTKREQNCYLEHRRKSFALDGYPHVDRMTVPIDKIGKLLSTPITTSKRKMNPTLYTIESIMKTIEKLKLKPLLQYHYNRVIFRSVSHETGLQIWLDTDIIFCKEGDPPEWRSDRSPPPSAQTFPLAVMTVKLPKGLDAPDWLKSIVNSQFVLNGCRFQKFLHGVSKFYTYQCQLLPAAYSRPFTHRVGFPVRQWYLSKVDNQLHQDLNASPEEDPLKSALSSLSFNQARLLSSPSLSPMTSPRHKESEHTLERYNAELDKQSPAPLSSPQTLSTTPSASQVKHDESVVSLLDSTHHSSSIRDSKMKRQVTQRRYRDAVPLNISKRSPFELMASLIKPGGGAGTAGFTPLLTPIRIEPKTYFANERTFLQWINISVLMATLSIALTHWQLAWNLAFVMLALAFVFTMYASAVYHYRRMALTMRSIRGHYDDKYGATILFLLLFVIIISTLIFQMTVLPVPTTPGLRATRYYRIPLSSQFLRTSFVDATTTSAASAALAQLKEDIQTTTKFRLEGSFTFKYNQTLTSFDVGGGGVSGSCVLSKNGYRFSEINTKNTNTGTTETSCSLQFLSENWDVIYQLDVNNNGTLYTPTEVVLPGASGNDFFYGREVTQPIKAASVNTLQSLAMAFSSFSLWGIDVLSSVWLDTLEPVSSPVNLYYYGDVTTVFGTGSITKQALIGVSIWSLTSGAPPFWGELSISFPISIGEDLTHQEIIDAKYFSTQLSSNTRYFDPTLTSRMDQSLNIALLSNSKFCV